MISDPQFIQIALSAGATEQLIADLRARQMQFAGAGQMVSLFDIARQGVLTQEQVVQFLQLAGASAQAPAPQAPAPLAPAPQAPAPQAPAPQAPAPQAPAPQTSIAPAPTPAAPAPQARPVSPGPPEQGESDPPPRTSRIPKKRKARRAPRREQGIPAPALAAIGGGGVLLLLILFSLLSSGPDQTERGSPPQTQVAERDRDEPRRSRTPRRKVEAETPQSESEPPHKLPSPSSEDLDSPSRPPSTPERDPEPSGARDLDPPPPSPAPERNPADLPPADPPVQKPTPEPRRDEPQAPDEIDLETLTKFVDLSARGRDYKATLNFKNSPMIYAGKAEAKREGRVERAGQTYLKHMVRYTGLPAEAGLDFEVRYLRFGAEGCYRYDPATKAETLWIPAPLRPGQTWSTGEFTGRVLTLGAEVKVGARTLSCVQIQFTHPASSKFSREAWFFDRGELGWVAQARFLRDGRRLDLEFVAEREPEPEKEPVADQGPQKPPQSGKRPAQIRNTYPDTPLGRGLQLLNDAPTTSWGALPAVYFDLILNSRGQMVGWRDVNLSRSDDGKYGWKLDSLQFLEVGGKTQGTILKLETLPSGPLWYGKELRRVGTKGKFQKRPFHEVVYVTTDGSSGHGRGRKADYVHTWNTRTWKNVDNAKNIDRKFPTAFWRDPPEWIPGLLAQLAEDVTYSFQVLRLLEHRSVEMTYRRLPGRKTIKLRGEPREVIEIEVKTAKLPLDKEGKRKETTKKSKVIEEAVYIDTELGEFVARRKGGLIYVRVDEETAMNQIAVFYGALPKIPARGAPPTAAPKVTAKVKNLRLRNPQDAYAAFIVGCAQQNREIVEAACDFKELCFVRWAQLGANGIGTAESVRANYERVWEAESEAMTRERVDRLLAWGANLNNKTLTLKQAAAQVTARRGKEKGTAIVTRDFKTRDDWDFVAKRYGKGSKARWRIIALPW